VLVVGREPEVWIVMKVGGPAGPLVEGSGVVLGRPEYDRAAAGIGLVVPALARQLVRRGWLAEGFLAAEELLQQAGLPLLGLGRLRFWPT
jgi:hypothetical protein